MLFVEIAVSHKCDERKIRLGKRIIEIEVTDELGVNRYSKGKLKSLRQE